MSNSIYIQNSAGLEGDNAAINNPEDVADGKVVLLGIAGEGQVGLGTSQEAPTRFQIVQGTPDADENAIRSGIINKDDIVDAEFENYRVATKQVTTITPVTGNSGRATLKITRIDQGFEQYPRSTYEIQVEAGDTASQIVTKFKNAIQEAKDKASTINSPNRHIIEASGTSTLILTAIDPGLHKTGTAKREWISFVTGLEGDGATDFSIASTTAPDPGSGEYEQIFEYENKAQGNFGFYNTETPYAQRPPQYASEAVDYDLLILSVKTNAEKSVNKSFALHQHVIALPKGEVTGSVALANFGFVYDESA